jgi:hypothetical protein
MFRMVFEIIREWSRLPDDLTGASHAIMNSPRGGRYAELVGEPAGLDFAGTALLLPYA